MKESEMIIEMAQNNNGTVTAEMVTQAGISRGHLKHLLDSGKLERSGRGVYVLPHIFEDEIFALQCRFKRGVFSCETALFLWDLTDRTPNRYSMTFPHSYNPSSVKKQHVKCTVCIEELFEVGLTEIKTPGQNLVRVYNRERTLCDILKKGSKIDIQITTEAFKRYAKLPYKDIALLSEYSELFKVSDKVRSYLEVLL